MRATVAVQSVQCMQCVTKTPAENYRFIPSIMVLRYYVLFNFGENDGNKDVLNLTGSSILILSRVSSLGAEILVKS